MEIVLETWEVWVSLGVFAALVLVGVVVAADFCLVVVDVRRAVKVGGSVEDSVRVSPLLLELGVADRPEEL